MLSGIGPGEHLRQHGIRVRVDSAQVGQNLQDHVAASIPVLLKKPTSRDVEISDGSGSHCDFDKLSRLEIFCFCCCRFL